MSNVTHILSQIESGDPSAAEKLTLTNHQCESRSFMAGQVVQSLLGTKNFLAAEQTSPSQQALRNEMYDQLADSLTQLRPEQRVAVILKHFEGWSLAEIAKEMDKSTTAIGGLLKRGLKRPNQLMSDRDFA